ncbi:MAG: UDP-glucose 4-epimerase GalE [Christensenellaceae bacterium]|jgi:UDP-glucose 4-epimerase
MSVLVLGGAGYIGSHTVRELVAANEDVAVADSLETGHRAAVDSGARFYEGDIRDETFLDSVFAKEKASVIMHFAANSLVAESMQNPVKYYENNVGGAVSLVKAMAKYGAESIVFSSTAATYGEPKRVPILEQDDTTPANPYGETKLAMEKLFKWSDVAYGIRYVSLRYFNAAGADNSGEIGEDHSPETHLIPLVLQVPLGKRQAISVYGTDYPTKDGTCVRDYIHVTDLAEAHILAMRYLADGGKSDIFNLGNGVGFTVKEVVEAARKITGHSIPCIESARREGDPAKLIAASEKAASVLGWRPKHAGLDSIIGSAWKWHSMHPDGFASKK